MFRKDAMNKSKQLMVCAFEIKIFTLITGILLAYKLGASTEMDVYIVILGIILLLSKVVGDGIVMAMIPILQDLELKYGKERKYSYLDNLFTFMIFFNIITMILIYLLSPMIVRIFGPGFRGLDLALSIKLFRMGIPIIGLTWLKKTMSGFLQSEHSFKMGAKSGVYSSSLSFIYILLLFDKFELEGMMITGIIGGLIQLFLTARAVKKRGYTYHPSFNFKDTFIKKVIMVILPIAISIEISEVTMAMDNSMSSILSPGSVSGFSYANEILGLILGIFIYSIITTLFPILSEKYNTHDMKTLNNTINYGIDLIILIIIPVTMVLFFMSEPIVRIVYERGNFDRNASIETAKIMRYLSIGLMPAALIPFITRIYYALQDTKTPIKLGIISLGLNFILNLILSPMMGIAGIALSTSLSLIVNSAYGLFNLNSTLFFSNKNHYISRVSKAAIASLIMLVFIKTLDKILLSLSFLHITSGMVEMIIILVSGFSIYYLEQKMLFTK